MGFSHFSYEKTECLEAVCETQSSQSLHLPGLVFFDTPKHNLGSHHLYARKPM